MDLDRIRLSILYAIAAYTGFLAAGFAMYTNTFLGNVRHLTLGATILLLFLVTAQIPRHITIDMNTEQWRVAAYVLLAVLLLLGAYELGAPLLAEDKWVGKQGHFHADYRVIVNGDTRELIDPKPFCGDYFFCVLQHHTGSKELHDHDDDRIHIHGPRKDWESATLSAFFDAFDGELSSDAIRFPTNDGWVNVTANETHQVKVLVKHGLGADRAWHLLKDPETYLISPFRDGSVDKLYIVYDSQPPADALDDVRLDDRYDGPR